MKFYQVLINITSVNVVIVDLSILLNNKCPSLINSIDTKVGYLILLIEQAQMRGSKQVLANIIFVRKSNNHLFIIFFAEDFQSTELI